MEQKKQADSPVAEAVKAFLASQSAAIAREQRSPWITPWELVARLPPSAARAVAVHPESVEAALRALSVPCAKIAGSRRYLLASVQPVEACLTPQNFRPSDVAADLKLSLSGAGG